MIWQLYFILKFPDVDTDAYIHHSIARQIILSPKDLGIHWVWLPLFHYLSAGGIILGANFFTIRFVNIFIWSLIPIILFFFLFNNKEENNLFIAFTSSMLCALFPIGILMGTTAQPEPLFTLLILLFAICSEKNKFILSSILLTLACMLRYEAWAVLFVAFIFYFLEFVKTKKIFNEKFIVSFIPTLAILIWAILRIPFDGKFFGFLFKTQQFVKEALNQTSSFQGGFFKVILDFIHYPIIVPFLFMGINILLIPFGFIKVLKTYKWLLFSGLGILVFITISWIAKSNLGLNRHFVALIPLYSIVASYGLFSITDFFNSKSKENKLAKYLNIKFAIILLVSINSIFYILLWLNIWNKDSGKGFPDKKATADFVKKISDEKTIFCNDAVIEIFSEIDFKRFNRTWMDDNPTAPDVILQTAEKEDYVYVITTSNKWKNINNIGEIIFQTKTVEENENYIYVLKVIKADKKE